MVYYTVTLSIKASYFSLRDSLLSLCSNGTIVTQPQDPYLTYTHVYIKGDSHKGNVPNILPENVTLCLYLSILIYGLVIGKSGETKKAVRGLFFLYMYKQI